jgi:hypothetical protein
LIIKQTPSRQDRSSQSKLQEDYQEKPFFDHTKAKYTSGSNIMMRRNMTMGQQNKRHANIRKKLYGAY